MIQAMLELLSTHGSDLCSLRAKVTGGAQVIGSSLCMGAQNTEAVLSQLIEKRIFVAGLDVGGTISRTARFNSATGELVINTSEHKTYSI